MNSPYHVLFRRAYHPLTTYCSFGFLDSISQPAVQGVDTNLHPGQEPAVRQGIILLGREGDATQRPPWALDGSFLAFRYLSQNVPEFDTFLKKNAIPIPDDPNLPKDLGSELLGARLVGRWKSGKLCNFCCSLLTEIIMRWCRAQEHQSILRPSETTLTSAEIHPATTTSSMTQVRKKGAPSQLIPARRFQEPISQQRLTKRIESFATAFNSALKSPPRKPP